MAETPKFRIMAVIVGWLAFFGANLLLNAPIGIWMAVTLVSKGARDPQQIQAMAMSMAMDPLLLTLGAITGMIAQFVGGFTAAAIAKHDHVQHALGVPVISGAMAIIAAIIWPGKSPLIPTIISLLLSFPAAALGGHVKARMAARRLAASPGVTVDTPSDSPRTEN